MSTADALLDLWADYGVRFASGVPCSSLGELIEAAGARQHMTYIAAANEGDAVAMATGSWLGGGPPGVVILQNSGLGNAISPLTSLVATIQAPLLAYVGWRGGPSSPDEPQHDLMGAITPDLLRLCGVEPLPCDGSAKALLSTTRSALARVIRGERIAILVQGGDLAGKARASARADEIEAPEICDLRAGDARPRRSDVLAAALRLAPPEASLISTTGKTSRELFTLEDRPSHFYQVGSMGCASSVALGVAHETQRPVIVVDGDGAALMRLGALSTVGWQRPGNLLHILLDNAVHDSTGGQPTAAGCTDLALVAAACGYPRVARCDGVAGFSEAMRWALVEGGPAFVHVRIAKGSMEPLGRPTLHPADNALRFRAFNREAA